MKKFISLTLIMLMVFVLCSCGGNGNSGSTSGSSKTTYKMKDYLIVHKASGSTSLIADLATIGDSAEDWTLEVSDDFKTFTLTHLDKSLSGSLSENKEILEKTSADEAYTVNFNEFDAEFFHCNFDNATNEESYILVTGNQLTFGVRIAYEYFGGMTIKENNSLFFEK